MEISVSNNNFIVVSSSGTLTIPIDAIEKFTAKTAYETVVVFYRQGKTNRYIELKVSEITNPVFADFNALVTWCSTNLVEVFDYNDLINKPTIPTDINELTDDDGLLKGGTLTNRLYVSPTAINADYATIKGAVDWINANATTPVEIILDGGDHIIDETVEVTSNMPVNIKGLGSDITIIMVNDIAMEGNPMFAIKNSGIITLSRLQCVHFGNKAVGDVCITLETSGYHEFYDIIFRDFDVVIKDTSAIDGSTFVFNFICDNANTFYSADCAGGGSIDLETGTIQNTTVGIDLISATAGKDFIINGIYFYGTLATDKFINYNSNFLLNGIANIQNCGGNNIGIFQSGFNFTLTAGTYADVEMIGNTTYETKLPHFKVNVVDNALTTTVVAAGTYYKANFANGTTYTCKIKLENNKYTFLSNHKKDVVVYITGNLSVNQINRNVTVGLLKNSLGGIISPFTVRTATSGQPYSFGLIAYLSDLTKGDFFELRITSSSNGDIVTIQDLNIFGMSM